MIVDIKKIQANINNIENAIIESEVYLPEPGLIENDNNRNCVIEILKKTQEMSAIIKELRQISEKLREGKLLFDWGYYNVIFWSLCRHHTNKLLCIFDTC